MTHPTIPANGKSYCLHLNAENPFEGKLIFDICDPVKCEKPSNHNVPFNEACYDGRNKNKYNAAICRATFPTNYPCELRDAIIKNYKLDTEDNQGWFNSYDNVDQYICAKSTKIIDKFDEYYEKYNNKFIALRLATL